MASRELKITRIGNSRGVRLPAESLKRYRIGATVVMEERSDGILLRPTGPAVPKLSWEETARAMAASGEDWSDWDSLSDDGLDQIPWDPAKPRRVAEPKAAYKAGRSRGKRA
jgi:antitoxin component of MazEF toxin-antitoxin module